MQRAESRDAVAGQRRDGMQLVWIDVKFTKP